MDLYARFLEVQQNIKSLQAIKLELEKEMYIRFQNEIKDCGIGTWKTIDGDYMLKVVTKLDYKVNQDAAAQLGGLGMRTKYELDKKAYDLMTETDKGLVDACLTIKPAKPSFMVIKGEDV